MKWRVVGNWTKFNFVGESALMTKSPQNKVQPVLFVIINSEMKRAMCKRILPDGKSDSILLICCPALGIRERGTFAEGRQISFCINSQLFSWETCSHVLILLNLRLRVSHGWAWYLPHNQFFYIIKTTWF